MCSTKKERQYLPIDFPTGEQDNVDPMLDCLSSSHAFHLVGVEDVRGVAEICRDGLSKSTGIEVAGNSTGFEC